MNKATNLSILKYLATYAEPEAKVFKKLGTDYDNIVVIPCCNEDNSFLERVFTNINADVLVVLVVNSPVGQNQWQLSNSHLIQFLDTLSISSHSISAQCKLLNFTNLPEILVVDRNSNSLQIDPKKGVGLARKIGGDIALKLYSLGCIRVPWIFSTDADVILPNDYFNQVVRIENEISAIVLDFAHITKDIYLRKIQFLYDFKMRYYLAGLEFADVGYNYIPLGSTLIASMDSYAKVRGFPKRNAAEDFYLLNKLAKIAPVMTIDDCTIQIQSRFSDRVPFGTGPALQSIANLNSVDEYLYYHPNCFIYLQQWKFFLDSLWENNQLQIVEPSDLLLKQLYELFSCNAVFFKSKKQITNQKRWQQFVHQWFDAFKILKSVHFFDKKFERLNYKRLLKDDSFVKVTNSKLNLFINTHDKN